MVWEERSDLGLHPKDDLRDTIGGLFEGARSRVGEHSALPAPPTSAPEENFGGSPGESEGVLRNWWHGVAGGFVPAFVTQLGRNNLDPEARTVRSAFDAVLNRLPGASTLLDPARNVLGEDVYRPQAVGFGLLPVNLSPANSYTKDPVLDELDRLYHETGYAPGGRRSPHGSP